MFMYTVWKWDIEIIMKVSHKFGLEAIPKQASDYFKYENPDRKEDVWIKLHTTGDYDKILINAFHSA